MGAQYGTLESTTLNPPEYSQDFESMKARNNNNYSKKIVFALQYREALKMQVMVVYFQHALHFTAVLQSFFSFSKHCLGIQE